MKLDNQTLALIAVGASVAANCQLCLERNVSTARQCGADAQQIAEAIEIGKRVRQGAASKLDKCAELQHYVTAPSTASMAGECGCSS